jgi:maleylpyruvate isomerase
MRLHGYYRSSASFRVRIALNLKRIDYETTVWHLRHGAHLETAFGAINRHQLIPVLDDGGALFTQSLAIIEYLDETHPEPPLLPANPADRAYVRALAQSIACDIHPIDNLRVLKYLREHFAADEAAIGNWYNHWIATGFAAVEAMLASDKRTVRFCVGDAPGLADILLVPQIVNAANYNLDMTPYPTIQRIFDACMAMPAFADAHPRAQADAE